MSQGCVSFLGSSAILPFSEPPKSLEGSDAFPRPLVPILSHSTASLYFTTRPVSRPDIAWVVLGASGNP
jgi:hypothetical protein